MNHRERLVAVFERTRIDHLPWTPDLGYWLAAEKRRGRLPQEYEGQDGRARLHRELNSCVYFGYGASPAVCKADGVAVSTEEADGLRIVRMACDGHVLEQHSRWLPEAFCYAITKHYVTDVSQLAIVREIYARREYAPNPNADAPAKKINGHGHPITPAPRAPLPALMRDWVGVEGTIYMMADAREEVEKTLEAIDRSNDGFFLHVGNINSSIYHFADNLSAETFTGLWDAYCAEYYRRRVGQIHAAGKFCVTHLDGATKGLIPKLVDAGLDGIEALTPHPVGDITMEEMSRLMAPRDVVFWGGLPGAMFADPFTWDDLSAMISRLHDLYRSGQRVVVGSADQIPPNARIEDVRRVADYLAELGA